MRGNAFKIENGPFLAAHIHSGDSYELSHGHPIVCAPTGGSGSGPNAFGASVVGWDPAVKEVGVDAGYSPEPDMLRAPDVAVGNVPSKPGWIQGVPQLAIEYADVGQDEEKLQQKIQDLLGAGTRFLWVVRLTGPRRVEVHRPGEGMQVVRPGEYLHAPGVLQNAVLVQALYDRSEAERATLTNLLQRNGYADLDAVLQKGREEGREEGRMEGREAGRDEGRLTHARDALRRVLAKRYLAVPPEIEAVIVACSDLGQLDEWHDRAIDAKKLSEVFGAA